MTPRPGLRQGIKWQKRVPKWNEDTSREWTKPYQGCWWLIYRDDSTDCFLPSCWISHRRFSCELDWKQCQKLKATRGVKVAPCSCKPSKTSAEETYRSSWNGESHWWPLIRTRRKKKNRLAKVFCLLIGPVAMVTGWHHVIINRCLIRFTVHGKVLIKASRALVCTSAGQWLVASYGLFSMFTRWQMDRRQAACYPAGVRVRGQREGGQGGNDTDHCNCWACL